MGVGDDGRGVDHQHLHGDVDRRRTAGFALLVLGLVLVVIGLALLAGDDGDDAPAPDTTDAPTTTTTTTPTTTIASQVTMTVAAPTTDTPAETLEDFVPLLADALRDNNVEVLIARLHPAVLQEYDAATCREALEGATEGLDLVLLDVGASGQWDWPTPSGTTSIDDATTVTVGRTIDGKAVEEESHFAVVDGEWRWFTYCGAPPTSETTP